MARRDNDLVYSTDHGRMCPACDHPVSGCVCRPQSGRGGSGKVRVQHSTRGRRGKTVSVVTGLDLNPQELAELARALKQRCGSGGTVKDGQIEIQGEHVPGIIEFLRARGIDAR